MYYWPFQEHLFGYFLYQFHNTINCSIIYITGASLSLHVCSSSCMDLSFFLPVVLALERYRAVWHPIEYHNSMGAGKPWRRVMTYVCPAVLFAVLVNLPKFFEVEFVPIMEERTYYNSDTGDYFTVSDKKITSKGTVGSRPSTGRTSCYANICVLVVMDYWED